MKKILLLSMVLIFSLSQAGGVTAQTPILEIIKAAVVKVIKAVDLKIQRLQNKTIWMQNAQKVLENKMSELKLNEIGDWAEKQKTLYADYFDELWKIKNTITTYYKVKEVIQKQMQMVNEYSRAVSLFKQDRHFTDKEISYMHQVYSGILNESIKNIDQMQLVLNAFVTQMTDAKRLEIINRASFNIENNIADLRQFNQQNIRISLQRAKDKNDVDAVKKLYGL